jgi:hypothetical protein
MVSPDSSVLSVRARWCWMSRTVIPPAYREMIISLAVVSAAADQIAPLQSRSHLVTSDFSAGPTGRRLPHRHARAGRGYGHMTKKQHIAATSA